MELSAAKSAAFQPKPARFNGHHFPYLPYVVKCFGELFSIYTTNSSNFPLFPLPADGEKKRSMPTIPTITYTVKDRDTLTSVAARFDTTPSELTQLNRLASSFIYSGQQLLVPDKNAKASADGESDASTERSTNSPTDGRRKGSQEDLSQDEKGTPSTAQYIAQSC